MWRQTGSRWASELFHNGGLTRHVCRAINTERMYTFPCLVNHPLVAMSLNHHENRFVKRLQFAIGDSEVAQEFNIPRKARRLDLICRFGNAPGVFGALQEHCSHRTVIFEHESQPLTRHAVASAWAGSAWMLWESVRPKRRGREKLVPSPLERPPLGIVVADFAGDALRGAVPSLRRTRLPGIWATAELHEGGLCVVDTSRVRAQDGLAWWSWVGRSPNAAEEVRRLDALLKDPKLPIEDRYALQEAIMNGQLDATPKEVETAAQRLKRQALDEGHREGHREGGRAALLAVVGDLAPERLPELEKIAELDELQRAVVQLLKR